MELGENENLIGLQKNAIDDLQELLEKNYDAQKGFLTGENATRNIQLKKFLKKQAGQKVQFAEELANHLRSLNALPELNGSVAGSVHRAWMDIKTFMTTNLEETILKECLRGEKESEKEYVQKLEINSFPATITNTLQRQLAQIRITIAQVSSLEDLADHRALGY